MLERYEKFLAEFDKRLEKYFKNPHIKCKKGCADCCMLGDYPFSRLEAEYLMAGFQSLHREIKDKIRDNIYRIKSENPKMYQCPFLIDNLCSLYNRRGIVCRTHGLAYLSDGKIKLPECSNNGLNYSEVYNKSTGEVYLDNPIEENLRIDVVLKSPQAEKYKLESGEIRRLIDWFN